MTPEERAHLYDEHIHYDHVAGRILAAEVERLRGEVAAAKADAEEERYETNRTAGALQATEAILKDVRAEVERLREAVKAAEELIPFATAWHRSKKQDAAASRWYAALNQTPTRTEHTIRHAAH
jgi:chromosome segregation ATPase